MHSHLTSRGPEGEEIQDFLSSRLAAFKIPLVIEFSKINLPLLASGKFDKPQLRKLFEQAR